MRLDHGVNHRIVGGELAVEYADGRIERTSVSPERLGATLRAPRWITTRMSSPR
jgi:hypothetical protein